MKPYYGSYKAKSEVEHHQIKFVAHQQGTQMADVRHSEKDSGNESEPELSSCDFSKLNISPKPIHTRPSAVRIMSKKSALAQQLEREDSAQTTDSVKESTEMSSSQESKCSEPAADYTRCLRSRVIRHSNKVGFVSCTKNNEKSVKGGPTQTRSQPHSAAADNINHAQLHDTSYPGLIVPEPHALRTVTLADVSTRRRQTRPYDSLSLHSVASEEFMESDDELISINSDSNICASLSHCSSSSNTRHSSKRKRTTTLSADLEVESLFSASGDDSFSSGDNQSVSDISECEVEVTSEIPRKRHCSAAPPDNSDFNRPFLDLEKMQDKVEERAVSKTAKRKPKAIRISGIMCFSPIKSLSGTQYNDKEIIMSTRFCPLTPVESTAACYS